MQGKGLTVFGGRKDYAEPEGGPPSLVLGYGVLDESKTDKEFAV